MPKKTYWDTRGMMIAILDTVIMYNDNNITILKTEIVKGMFSPNYAYVLGVINAMMVFGYLTDNELGVHATYTGRDFYTGLPF